jgi:polyisoprenoid-binding protein YceI
LLNSSTHILFWSVLFVATFLVESFIYAADRTLLLDPNATKIRFVLEATLHNVEGSARLVEGKIRFDLERGSAGGIVRVDARSATTGIQMRDTTMHAEVLESERFPEVVFIPERLVEGRGEPSKRSLNVEGRIKIHGVEQSLTIPLETTVDQKRVRLQGRFVLPYVKWGMKDASTFLLRVGKTVEVHIDAVGMLD